jgi:hypothetical protein
MRINKKDILIILGSFLILLVVGIGSWMWFGESGLTVVIIASSILIVTAIFEVHRRLVIQADSIKNSYSQRTEPLLSLYFTIKPPLPLPDFGDFATTPDFLKKLTEIVYREKPELIVETGSGLSTLILAYCLKQIGKGKVISLDQDAKYAVRSQQLITLHGLEEVAKVMHAPLVDYEINGKKWLWYDSSHFQIEKPIDLLIVDGPPRRTQTMARYPALPLLYKYLGDKAIIIGDDGYRKDEKEMIDIWKKEFREFTYKFLKLERGAYLLYKQGNDHNSYY